MSDFVVTLRVPKQGDTRVRVRALDERSARVMAADHYRSRHGLPSSFTLFATAEAVVR